MMAKTLMLSALVAMVQGARVNHSAAVHAAVHAHSEAESHGEVIGSVTVQASVRAKLAFANENRSGCNFVDIKDVPASEKGGLTDADLAAIEADPNIVAYAYGPYFNGRDQILAWSYLGAGCSTGSPEYLWAFYPKSNQETEGKCANDRLKVTPSGSCGNTPGATSCKLCPSCSLTFGWGVSCNYEQTKFPLMTEMDLGGITQGTLMTNSAGAFRLAGADGQVMDKRIFVCGFSIMKGEADAAMP